MTIKKILSNFNTWCLCGNTECAKSQSFKYHLKQIENLIQKEIIGEDEETGVIEAMRDPETNGENYLRSEQRKKLKSVIGG